MAKMNYVAFLRGINVGGNNIIKMNELKIIFEKMDLFDVQTYIQSGNVIFNDLEKDKLKLVKKIENKLSETLCNEIKVSLFTLSEMGEIINKKPYKYGEENGKYKYDVIFLIEPLTAKEAMKEIKIKEGVDDVYEGNRVLYFKRLKEKIAKTYLTKIIGTPMYKYMTLRSWNTTEKIFDLMNLPPPPLKGGVSCKRCIIYEVRSVRKLFNRGVYYHFLLVLPILTALKGGVLDPTANKKQ